MDQPEFNFLLDRLRVQEERLEATIDPIRGGRGYKFVVLVRTHLAGAAKLREELSRQFDPAAPDLRRQAIERKALRLLEALNVLHVVVVQYVGDVGKRDIPVGIRYLIDALLEALMDESYDPLVHLDEYYMYSVLSPVDAWAEYFRVINVAYTDNVRPLILNLPGADPMNVTLAPILAHEVGHPVVADEDLLSEFNKMVDPTLIDPIWDECKVAGAEDAFLRTVLSAWIEELLCDALAVATTGPSMLYAALAFLPGSIAGRFGESHPDPGQRISLTLQQLNALGWTDLLREETPEVLEWSERLAAMPVDPDTDRILAKLSEVIPGLSPVIWEVARRAVKGPLFMPAEFAPVQEQAGLLLAEGVPPVELDGVGLSSWSIVLSTWLYGIRRAGGSPQALPDIVSDVRLNEFSLKAIELASVLNLWSQDDAPAT